MQHDDVSRNVVLPRAAHERRGLRRRARGLRGTEERDFFLMLIPELLGLLLLFLGPLVAVIGISLLKWDGLTSARFVGGANYTALVSDNLFWQSLYNTVYYTILSVGVGTVVAFTVALLWNQPVRGLMLYRALYYMPVIVPAVAGSLVWGHPAQSKLRACQRPPQSGGPPQSAVAAGSHLGQTRHRPVEPVDRRERRGHLPGGPERDPGHVV